jgi:hypothetical protein
VTAKTKALAERIIQEKGFYKPPEQLTVELNEQRRQEKAEMAAESEKLIKQVSYDMPRATKNKVEAVVFKTLQEKKHLEEMDIPDPELTLRPDTTKTLRVTKTRKYYHNGKWEMNPIEKCESWSCCMNADKNSEGCVAVKVDKSKWILSSYT